MLTPQPEELFRLLGRRADLLSLLMEGVQDKRDLEQELEISRSTLNRELRAFEDFNLIRRTREGFNVTEIGELGYRISNMLATYIKAIPILNNGITYGSIDPAVFRGAEVVEASPANPEKPISKFEQKIKQSFNIRGIFPIVNYQFSQWLIVEGSYNYEHLELIISEVSLENLNFDNSVHLGDRHIRLQYVKELPSYGLLISDDEWIWLGMYDTKGRIEGAIVNECDRAIDWANSVFAEYSERGTQITPSNLVGANESNHGSADVSGRDLTESTQ